MSRRNYSAETEISRLLNAPHSALAGLLARAQKMLSLQDQLNTALPPDYQDYCQLISYRNGLLILQADTAAWSTKLRFQEPQLIKQLKQLKSFDDIQKIKIKVRPKYTKTNPKIKAKPLSPESTEHLRKVAESFDQPALSAAFRHITEAE